jgi:hypothetical protein
MNGSHSKSRKTILKTSLAFFAALALVGAYLALPWLRTRFSRTARLMEWFRHVNQHPDWAVKAAERCGEAPFILPTDGYIGFLWGDSFRPGHRHQGIDIFGGRNPGGTQVVAAYAGYLTRLPEWKSSLIIRIPADPLQPDRQIWTYYTHLADAGGASYIAPDFPPGTGEKYVEAGTFLGFQGNYSGDPFNPVGVHLHFSIVLDRGADVENPLGGFRNELEIRNTLDPSPYLGLVLNADRSRGEIVICEK